MDELKELLIKMAEYIEALEEENNQLREKYQALVKEIEKTATIQQWLEEGKISKHQVEKVSSLIDEMGIEKTAEILSDITEIDYGTVIEQQQPKGLAKFLKI